MPLAFLQRVAAIALQSVWRQPQEGASVSLFGRRGVSPLQVYVLRPVTESNCVVARRGGKQLEVNDQSVTIVNSIRPGCLASLPSYGEAQNLCDTASGNILAET